MISELRKVRNYCILVEQTNWDLITVIKDLRLTMYLFYSLYQHCLWLFILTPSVPAFKALTLSLITIWQHQLISYTEM